MSESAAPSMPPSTEYTERVILGKSCISLAVAMGDIAFARQLIEDGVSINEGDGKRWTAMHYAVLSGCRGVGG